MRRTAICCLLAVLAAPALGDTVHLVNGNKFEEVQAEMGPDEVRIRMPHGEIVLPARVVARVERSRSIWRQYEERAAALRSASAPARQWLELARWAEKIDYRQGMESALLRAATLEPDLRGLAPLMASIGYIRDGEGGEWLTEAAYMRRRGYRLWGSHWLPQQEHEARVRAHQEAEARRREDERQERIARAIEALAVAQLSRAAEREVEPEPVETRRPLVAVYNGAYFGFAATPVVSTPADPERTTYEDLVGRQPGSLFPVRPRRHSGSAD